MRFSLHHLVIALVVAQAGCAGIDLDRTPPDPRIREEWESHMAAAEAAAIDRRFEAAERGFLAAVESVTTISGNEKLLIATLRRLAGLYVE